MDDVSPPVAITLFSAVAGAFITIAGKIIKVRRELRMKRAEEEADAEVAATRVPAASNLPVPGDLFSRMEQTVRSEADWKVAAYRAKWDADDLRKKLELRNNTIADLERELAIERHHTEGLREELETLRASLGIPPIPRRAADDTRDPRPAPGRPGGVGRHPVAVAPGDRPTRRPLPGKGD